jgi:predicted ATPase
VDPSAPLRKQIRLLEGEIEDRAPERVQALPLLGHMLNLNIPDNDFTKTLEPKDRKGALHALLEDCLKASTRDEPLLLVIEDLHWIDALSHDLLEELVRAMTNHRICFVLAYRPPQLQRLQAPRLEGLPAFTKIELSELTVAECEQAIRAKLAQLYPSRSGAVPPVLVEKLMARAQGNPFFLEELLNFLRDRGLDPRDPADLNKIELPDSLHTLILSRIDQLTEHEKSTLRVASIIGRLFRAAWLTGYYPSLGELPQVKADLDELNALDITPLDTPEPELAYLFKHIVTHEVTYESLPFATRARLHELLAGYLETIAAPLETIAHHYGQSDNTAKQREYWQRAGQAAQVAFANEAALDYFSRLLPLLDDPRSQLDVYLKRSAVRELLGQWAEAEADQRAALVLGELAGDAAAVARCRQALGKLFRLRGDFAAALSWLAQASDGFTALDDRTGLAWTRIEMGIVWWQKGEYASARRELEIGLALARALADPTPAALALNNLGNVESDQGDYAAGQALYEQSLAHSREMGDKRGIAAGLGNLGALAAGQGNYVAAQALYEESLALFREIGDKRGIAVSLVNLGALAFYQGDYAAARALCDESLALFREMGDKRGIALSVINLGHLLLEQGDAASAQTAFRESLTLLQEVGDKNSMFYGFAGLAAVAAHQANAPRAALLAAAAETLRSSLGAAWDMVEGRIFAGAVAAARAALSEAEFNAAWEAGSKMTLDEAVELALN